MSPCPAGGEGVIDFGYEDDSSPSSRTTTFFLPFFFFLLLVGCGGLVDVQASGASAAGEDESNSKVGANSSAEGIQPGATESV
jgi:hypothetical protein